MHRSSRGNPRAGEPMRCGSGRGDRQSRRAEGSAGLALDSFIVEIYAAGIDISSRGWWVGEKRIGAHGTEVSETAATVRNP